VRHTVQGGPALDGMKLVMESERVGTLTVPHPDPGADPPVQAFPVSVHAMPTLIETFKSHNDFNLMKSADVGQCLMAHANGDGDVAQCADMVATLRGMEDAGQLPAELQRGLTPPMLTPCARPARRAHA
jgi:TAFII55 protein conserved region